jgi:hypothetical protein
MNEFWVCVKRTLGHVLRKIADLLESQKTQDDATFQNLGVGREMCMMPIPLRCVL